MVLELLRLTGDRLICPHFELYAGQRPGGPPQPRRGSSLASHLITGGMMCNAYTDPKTQQAAAAGYRVYK